MNLRFTIQIYYGIYLPASVPLLVCTLFVVIICLLLATCTKHSRVQGDTRSAVYVRHMVRSLQLLTLCLLRNREECSVPPWQQVEKKKTRISRNANDESGPSGFVVLLSSRARGRPRPRPRIYSGSGLKSEIVNVKVIQTAELAKKKESFETPRTRAIINHLTYSTGCTRNACASVRDKFGTN